jgi:hypothetical protein
MITKICSNCHQEKPEKDFRKEKFKKQCRTCLSLKSKEYNKKNEDKYKKNQEKFRKSSKRKEYLSQYYILNENKMKLRQKHYENRKYSEDPIYRMRRIISASITKSLRSRNFSKSKISFLNHINYSLQELKEYLEKQFEPWMTWLNRGKYNSKTWNDNDQSTWTWQIDHVVPHSTFKYSSMEDEEFKKCWSLENLRPYSAKQNIIDGTTGVRH